MVACVPMSTTPDGSDASAVTPPTSLPWLVRVTRRDSRARRLLLAASIYVVCTSAYAAVAGPDRLFTHTPFNHYALLADAWLHGRQSLPNGPPAYTQNNDFVAFAGKTYISFPPFPAM